MKERRKRTLLSIEEHHPMPVHQRCIIAKRHQTLPPPRSISCQSTPGESRLLPANPSRRRSIATSINEGNDQWRTSTSHTSYPCFDTIVTTSDIHRQGIPSNPRLTSTVVIPKPNLVALPTPNLPPRAARLHCRKVLPIIASSH
ncbi:hypothetical protein LX36DRAFT_56110 [Colletotrichum falcatum]|nr:hypothetical protein LX36DRAFT_56110 [Colletotrichum falcatum]